MNALTPMSGSSQGRLFYSLASLLLLVITFIGFSLFYMEGKAFPGHDLPPPTRTLLIVHGSLMSAWMLLAVVQPWLIARRNKKLHQTLGKVGALIALAVVLVGFKTGIEATRITPAQLVRFSLAPKPFLMVPLCSAVLFGIFVLTGVLKRKRPEIHRPMMFLASLVAVSAALGRMPSMSVWYLGTGLEQAFTAFASTIAIGIVLWVIKCGIQRPMDRWMAMGLVVMTLWFYACSQFARTAAWDRLASALLG